MIYWITYKNAVPILKNIPYIKEVVPYNSNLFSKILAREYDIMINLDLSIDGLTIASLVKSRKKIGYGFDSEGKVVCYNKESYYWFILSHNDFLKKNNKKTYQRHMLNLIGLKTKEIKDYPILVSLTKEEKRHANIYRKSIIGPFIKKNNLNNMIIGLNTGGGYQWDKKEWPVKKHSSINKSDKNT